MSKDDLRADRINMATNRKNATILKHGYNCETWMQLGNMATTVKHGPNYETYG